MGDNTIIISKGLKAKIGDAWGDVTGFVKGSIIGFGTRTVTDEGEDKEIANEETLKQLLELWQVSQGEEKVSVANLIYTLLSEGINVINFPNEFGINNFPSDYAKIFKKNGPEQRFNTTQSSIEMSGNALMVDNSGGNEDIIVTVNEEPQVVPAGEIYGPDLLNYSESFEEVAVTLPSGYSNISTDKKFGVTPYAI